MIMVRRMWRLLLVCSYVHAPGRLDQLVRLKQGVHLRVGSLCTGTAHVRQKTSNQEKDQQPNQRSAATAPGWTSVGQLGADTGKPVA